jgi:hypothetical protein
MNNQQKIGVQGTILQLLIIVTKTATHLYLDESSLGIYMLKLNFVVCISIVVCMLLIFLGLSKNCLRKIQFR